MGPGLLAAHQAEGVQTAAFQFRATLCSSPKTTDSRPKTKVDFFFGAANSEMCAARWGDEDDEEGFAPSGEDGTCIVEYRTNEHGEKVKVTKKFVKVTKMVKVNQFVQARKQWKKFGACRQAPPGPEPGVTMMAEECVLDLKQSEETQKEKKKDEGAVPQVVCRACGQVGDHWTVRNSCDVVLRKPSTHVALPAARPSNTGLQTKCPYKDKMPALDATKPAADELKPTTAGGSESAACRTRTLFVKSCVTLRSCVVTSPYLQVCPTASAWPTRWWSGRWRWWRRRCERFPQA
jgi:hypothetical protein